MVKSGLEKIFLKFLSPFSIKLIYLQARNAKISPIFHFDRGHNSRICHILCVKHHPAVYNNRWKVKLIGWRNISILIFSMSTSFIFQDCIYWVFWNNFCIDFQNKWSISCEFPAANIRTVVGLSTDPAPLDYFHFLKFRVLWS